MNEERPLNERPAARPTNSALPDEQIEVVPIAPVPEANLRRDLIVTRWILIAAVAGIIIGNVLANAGTTRTWICLGSAWQCEAIEITPLGSFGIFLQWTTPIVALVAAAMWWNARKAWKERKDAASLENPKPAPADDH